MFVPDKKPYKPLATISGTREPTVHPEPDPNIVNSQPKVLEILMSGGAQSINGM